MDDKIIYELNSHFNSNELSDDFQAQLYDFYYNRFYNPIMINKICELCSILFGIIFLFFFFVLLDWNNLLTCGNENTYCQDISFYISLKPLNWFQIIIFFLLITYFNYKVYSFFSNLEQLKLTNNYYKDILDLKGDELNTMTWTLILKKIINVQHIFDEHDITNKILRKENYMIALIDKQIFNINPSLYTKQLDLNLQYIIIDNIDEMLNTSSTKRRFIFYGILNLLLLPFIFIFQIIYFLISNIDDFYSNKNVLGPRRYNILAKRKFREYNELPHYFEERINKSIKFSNEYTKQFETPILESISKFICLICGSFICFFLLISILDESIILYVRLFDRTMIFYMGVVSAISSVCRSFIKSPEETVYDPEGIMKKIVEYTHYMPKRWENKCNTYKVRDEFLSFFQYKIVIFIYDLISVITTPFILFRLTRDSQKIVSFIKTYTIDNNNVNNICTFAQKKQEFDDDKMKKSLIMFKKNVEENK